ncbi:diguanylate cyclase [Myxococcaceae bacterium JPH2]|nr:diguanylate cyclase [Myxococcaceae bacterium JPH2]
MASVLLAEPSAPVAGALRRFLDVAAQEVTTAASLEEALRHALAQPPPSLVVASATGGWDGEALCRSLRDQGSDVPVLLLYPPDEEHADERAASVGADACLVGPLKRGNLLGCVRLLSKLVEARRKPAPAPAAPLPTAAAASASADFEFLKRLLLLEVKRSRRYRYPIALLVVELDAFSTRVAALPLAERTAVLGEVLGLLIAGVRDIDVAVPFADGRFGIFLPHTPRTGALVVAERLRAKVKSLRSLPGVSASVGVAVSEPTMTKASPSQGQGVSFGGMLKEAGEALRRAQAAGGDRVEATAGATGVAQAG